jgi:hypothetical protein
MKKKNSKKEYSTSVTKVKEPAAIYKTVKHETPMLNTERRKEKQKKPVIKLKPMTIEELKERVKKSEEDIKAGRVYSQEEVKAHFKNKFKAR